MNFKKTKLQNGLTVITVPIKDSPSVTVLVTVHTGSKYETKKLNGLSHFLEHMCFKGTNRRPKTIDIAIELDSIGSEHNAFTSHEFTSYYAKAHPSHLDKILDVVSDMYLNPVFDELEIEKERGVIIEEINMYDDMPQNKVWYVLAEALYGDQPAGWDILGPKENIKKITRDDFLNYRKEHYVAGATTVTVVGSFEEPKVIAHIEELFKEMSQGAKKDKLPVIENQKAPFVKIKTKETDQTHIIIGVRTFKADDKRHSTLRVLNSVLGGGMSGRLWQKLRTEMGSCYYAQSDSERYTDHGILYVAAGIDLARIEEVTVAILKELNRLKVEKISNEELQKAKDYLAGHIYLGLESSDSLANYYSMRDVLGDMDSPDELVKKIQSVTAEEIQNVAKEVFLDSGLNMAVVGNLKDDSLLKKILHF